MRLPCEELEFSQFCWSEENPNQVLKTNEVKLFKDLLRNKVFPKQIFLWNLKMKLSFSRGLVRKFLG